MATKMSILTDSSGKIIGTVVPILQKEGGLVEITPNAGERVHEVEIPEEFVGLKAEDLHKKLLELSAVKEIIKK